MLNVGTPELLVILLVALIVLGPAKLPGAARQIGRAVGELRRMSSGFQAELRDAFHEADAGSSSGAPSYDEHQAVATADDAGGEVDVPGTGRADDHEPPPA